MTRFVRFVENNDHEGEEWRFWLQVNGNEKELKRLRKILFATMPSNYTIDDLSDAVPESHVDTMVSFAFGGYMDSDHKCTGRLELPLDDAFGNLDDLFYKGQIMDFFKNDDPDV